MAAKVSSHVVQDDARERIIAEHCGLIHINERYGFDAKDEAGNFYELKSAVNRKRITTARDIKLDTIQKWYKSFWIAAIGKYIKSREKIFNIDRLWIVHPNYLNEFLYKIEDRVTHNILIANRLSELASHDSMCIKNEATVQHILHRGITLNNQDIPLKLFEKHGFELNATDSTEATYQIKEYVKIHPIDIHSPYLHP